MAKTRKLLHTSEEATILGPGVAGRKVSVLEFTVPEGAKWILPNGSQMVLKLYDGSGSEITPDAFVYFYRKRKGEDGEEFLTKLSYAPFYDLAPGDQRNERYAKQTRLDLGDVAGAIFTEGDKLQFWVEAQQAVDLSQAATRFEITVELT